MAYRTILTVISDPDLAAGPLRQAEKLARINNGHLEVLCLGVDRTQTGYYYAGANAMILQESVNRAQRDADAIVELVEKTLEKSDIRWSAEKAVSQMPDAGRHVADRARFADLVVLGKPYGKVHGAELEAIIEGALFEGLAPVLMVPDDAPGLDAPGRVIIGWDESDVALNAVRAALPTLITADAVNIVVIDPPAHARDRSDPGGRLSQYLSRHRVKCEIDVLARTLPRVSDVLMRHAKDTGASIIVMGAYGHSRFREAILGGATRNMLENAEVTVFMKH